MGKTSSGQFDMLKTQLVLVFQLLLQLLNPLPRFHSAPNSLQAGFFTGDLCERALREDVIRRLQIIFSAYGAK
jgi:hypothetical protein